MKQLNSNEIRNILNYEMSDLDEYDYNSCIKNMFISDKLETDSDPSGYFSSELQSAIRLSLLSYLGFPIEIDVPRYLNRGVDIWVKYFTTDWWGNFSVWYSSMDKTRSDWEPDCIETFIEGLFLGLLSERWDDIDKVCQWFDWDMPMGYMGDDLSVYNFATIYLSLAASLRSTPMPGVEELPEKVSKFKRGPKLFYEAWQAVLNQDQPAFEKAFVKTLKQQASRKFEKSIYVDYIAPHQSVLAMTARRLGMKLPELEPKLDAFLVLPEKLGLPSEYAN